MILSSSMVLRGTLPVLAASALSFASLIAEPLRQPEDSVPETPAVESENKLFFDELDVQVVNVEVVVTDSEGRPVTGLGRQDFEIFEDGKAVQVTNFLAIEDLGEGSLGDFREFGRDSPAIEATPTYEGTQGLQLVILVDTLNIERRSRTILFDSLRRYLREEAGVDGSTPVRMMVATLGRRLDIAQPFTSDLSAILEALDREEKKQGRHTQESLEKKRLGSQIRTARLRDYAPTDGAQAIGGSDGRDNDFEMSVMAVQELARDVRIFAEKRHSTVRKTAREIERFAASIGGIPGRKAVLYLSDGAPRRPGESLMEAWISQFDAWVQRNDGPIRAFSTFAMEEFQRILTSFNSPEFDAAKFIEDMVRQAGAHKVVFYPVTPGGSGTAGLGAESLGSLSGAASANVSNSEIFGRQTSLLRMADATGGVALTGSPNIGGLIEQVRRDFQTYYSLGYRPVRDPDRKNHKVTVKVNRPGVKVRYLKSQRQADPLDRLQTATLSALFYGHRENPLDLRLEPVSTVKTGRNRYLVTVMVKVPFENLILLQEDSFHNGRLSLYVGVRDRRGGSSPMQRVELPIHIPDSQFGKALASAATYPLELETNSGDKTISVGVRDRVGKINSTANLQISVGGDEGDQVSTLGSALD